jgi:two-component system response regulator FixJ
LDGVDVFRRLRASGTPLPPVIILTAYQSVQVAKEAVKLGALDYLPKPFERTQVLNAVRGALTPAGREAGKVQINVD